MADTDVTINDNATVSRKIDTRTVGAGTDEHRQVMVVGDPVTAANVGVVDANGAQSIKHQTAATATLANVSGSATSVTLQASNTARLGLFLYNDSTASCYVKFGTAASATSFVVFMGPQAFWEMPYPLYTGIVTGIWTSAAGAMRVTELTV